MVVVSSRFEKFQVKSGVSPRPDFFKVTTSRFEFLKSRSEPRVYIYYIATPYMGDNQFSSNLDIGYTCILHGPVIGSSGVYDGVV